MLISRASSFFDIARQHGWLPAVGMTSKHLDIYAPRSVVYDYWDFPADGDYELKVVNAEVDNILGTAAFPFRVGGPDAVIGKGRGMWDKFAMDFTETELYESMEMRYIDGVPWDETPTYRSAVEKIKLGEAGWGAGRGLDGLQQRCESIDRLYHSIVENGYRSQLDPPWNKSLRGSPIPDEVRLAVARDGSYIRIQSGRHRLAIAKLLGLDVISALVQIEHRDWEGSLDVIEEISLR